MRLETAVAQGYEAVRRNGRARYAALAACAVIAILASACSGDDGTGTADARASSAAPSSSTTPKRPRGPAADLSNEITGGNGAFVGEAMPADVKKSGYVEREYVAAGTATAYKANGPLSPDGRWAFEPDTNAAFRTRILVRGPTKATKSSGTVVVEWLNVSGGVDANPDYASLKEELTRQGDVWVGVSAQIIGVEGGPVLVRAPGAEDLAGKGLKAIDPTRYGSLQHPGDGYSFDVFTQVARAVREGGPAMGNMKPRRILAVGESQSATTASNR